MISGPTSGELSVKRALDREQTAEYTIHVSARDKGTPSLTTIQEVNVKVGDENDHSPTFSPRTYSKEVAENVDVGSILLQVTAMDLDTGLNGDIRYVIQTGDPNEDFWMDSHLGDLYVQKALDFERKNIYELEVVAMDLGLESRMDTASITITVSDINDNAPEFKNPPMMAYVEENQQGTPVYITTIQTVDRDSAPNAGVSYTMVDGDRSLFSVDSSTGEVLLQSALDREEMDQYILVIRATDTGKFRF